MGDRRRRFSDEFKQEAVRLAFEGGRSVAAVGSRAAGAARPAAALAIQALR